MAYNIQIRRDLAAEWTTVNPVIADGEFGFEQDTKKLKIGDGVTDWINLPYILGDTLSMSDRVTFSADGYYDIPAKWLLKGMLVQPDSDQELNVGSTIGGDEYFSNISVTTTGDYLSLNLFANSTKRVYISNIVDNCVIVFIREYIKQS